MTNSTTTAMNSTTRNYSHNRRSSSDTAPMVVTRLSGWIDVGEVKTAKPSWIIHTHAQRATQ